MTQVNLPAFFLWVGSPIPDLARMSVLSAVEAGFKTTLFTDRAQAISHPNLQQADWREVDLPWSPDNVRLRGDVRPCFAAFSDLFRFTLLSQKDGWWFDCDTLILRQSQDFAALLNDKPLVLGREDRCIINGAVIGSMDKTQMQVLKEEAQKAFPILERWGVVGPALITKMIENRSISAHVVSSKIFYPVHHNDVAKLYLPKYRDDLRAHEADWYCLSLWGEVLSRSGLAHLSPPPDSYVGDLLARRPALGRIDGDPARMAAYLAENLRRLDDMSSGRLAMKTLIRKLSARLPRRGT